MITLDTLRADRIGCYGYQKSLTPVLDHLAETGVLYERAYSNAPLTLTSHASLFTGLQPAEHGLRTNGRGKIDPSIPTLTALLADSGYDCGAFVGAFVLDSVFGLDRGFAVYDDEIGNAANAEDALHRERKGATVVDSALAWLTMPREKPFYCWVHLYDAHSPYDSHPEVFEDRFRYRPYDGEIAYVDRQIQRLMHHLRSTNQEQNTLVVVVGDHGEGLGDHVEENHGYTLYNSTQHVPLIFRWPGRLAEGHRHPGPVSLVDVFPTMCELLGLSFAESISGQSFSPSLHGKPVAPRECYAATDDPLLQEGWSPLRSLTDDRWKYIRTATPELFDLASDPGERRNLFESLPEQAAVMESRLMQLEHGMTVRKSIDVQLSESERRALESLGYLAGASGNPEPQQADARTDVKDMLQADVAARTALEMLRHGAIDQAIVRLRKITAEAPLHLGAKVFLGQALEGKQDRTGAIDCYQDALRIKPDHLDALVRLGCALGTQGCPEEGVQYLDEALRINSRSVGAHAGMGVALLELGQTEQGIGHLIEALRLEKDLPKARILIAEGLRKLDRGQEAIPYLEEELQRDPRSVPARLNLAMIYARDDPNEAFRYLLESLDLQPRNPHIHFQLAELFVSHGRADEAIPYFIQTQRLMPDHPRVKQALAESRKSAGKSGQTDR